MDFLGVIFIYLLKENNLFISYKVIIIEIVILLDRVDVSDFFHDQKIIQFFFHNSVEGSFLRCLTPCSLFKVKN